MSRPRWAHVRAHNSSDVPTPTTGSPSPKKASIACASSTTSREKRRIKESNPPDGGRQGQRPAAAKPIGRGMGGLGREQDRAPTSRKSPRLAQACRYMRRAGPHWWRCFEGRPAWRSTIILPRARPWRCVRNWPQDYLFAAPMPGANRAAAIYPVIRGAPSSTSHSRPALISPTLLARIADHRRRRIARNLLTWKNWAKTVRRPTRACRLSRPAHRGAYP